MYLRMFYKAATKPAATPQHTTTTTPANGKPAAAPPQQQPANGHADDPVGDLVSEYRFCGDEHAFNDLEAARRRLWATLSPDAQLVLKGASEAAKKRLAEAPIPW